MLKRHETGLALPAAKTCEASDGSGSEALFAGSGPGRMQAEGSSRRDEHWLLIAIEDSAVRKPLKLVQALQLAKIRISMHASQKRRGESRLFQKLFLRLSRTATSLCSQKPGFPNQLFPQFTGHTSVIP